MMCAFCRQDVINPCHNVQEMQQRAEHHIDRCERAFAQQGGSHPQSASSTESGTGRRR